MFVVTVAACSLGGLEVVRTWLVRASFLQTPRTRSWSGPIRLCSGSSRNINISGVRNTQINPTRSPATGGGRCRRRSVPLSRSRAATLNTPLWDWIVSQVDTLSIRSEANLQLKGKIEKIGEANLNCLELVKKMIDF